MTELNCILYKVCQPFVTLDCEEPYCVIELDYPIQKHVMDLATSHDQFLFDITSNSEELSFSIFDKAKNYGSELFFFI